MIDLSYEMKKINKNLRDNIISESIAQYEILKLKCVAKKFDVPWEADISHAKSVEINLVTEDYNELNRLYESGMIKKKQYYADMLKILSLCESFGLIYPGGKDVADLINIRVLSENIDELNYDDFPEEDEETYSTSSQSDVTLPDGTFIVYIIDGSEESYYIDGNESSDMEVWERLLSPNNVDPEYLVFLRQYYKEMLENPAYKACHEPYARLLELNDDDLVQQLYKAVTRVMDADAQGIVDRLRYGVPGIAGLPLFYFLDSAVLVVILEQLFWDANY